MPPESPRPRTQRARAAFAPTLEERARAAAGLEPIRREAAATQPLVARAGPIGAPRQRQPVAAPPIARILGIDPGTRVVGWGVIELGASGPRLVAAGALRAGNGDLAQRLGLIRRELDSLFERHRPNVVAVEMAFAHKNVQSALRIGEGRGVVLSCAAAAGAEVHQYPPASAKKALVGHGAAHKTQVAAMVARRLGLDAPPQPLDASDALALALTHVLRRMPGFAR